ncbi:MAG: beta-N-acetylhexosaminidase [Thermomicrobiales bacterium]
MPRLPLLPQPREIEETGGTFLLDSGTPVQYAAGASDATVRSAENLVAALHAQLGVELPLRPTSEPDARATISLLLTERDASVFPADRFGWSWPDDLADQAYRLTISANGVVVLAASESGLFYGVQTLIQIVKATGRSWPCLTISDWPVLPVRGLMQDVSRMKVARLETLEKMVKKLANYKYNHFQLHTEHTFDFPRHPEIGANASPITPAEIVHLDRVCREHHIELVPNLQSLGHQRTMLSKPKYAHLAETPWNWSLATSREESFELLDELYGDLLPAFSSKWFNVNADEPWDYGRGQSAAMTERDGIGNVFLYHIERLQELAAKHGRKIMIWADVLKYHPELADSLPEDILLLDWWYEPKDRYETVDLFTKTGRDFWVCPGTSSWSSLFPRLENAVINVERFVRDGVAAGASGMLMTDWGDGGHYQQMSPSWYPLIWAAESGWTGSETSHQDFQPAFSLQFFGDSSGELARALYRLGTAMTNDLNWRATWNTAVGLWEEPLLGKVADASLPEVTAEAREAARALEPMLGQIADAGIRHDLAFTLYQIQFVVEKVETTRAVRDWLKSASGADRQPLDALDTVIDQLRAQRQALPGMVAEFRQRWIEQSKRAEIRGNLSRFENLIARYDAAIDWLTAQREGYADGKPVDTSLSTYDDSGYAVLFQESRQNIARLIEIIGFDALPEDIKGWIGNLETA